MNELGVGIGFSQFLKIFFFKWWGFVHFTLYFDVDRHRQAGRKLG